MKRQKREAKKTSSRESRKKNVKRGRSGKNEVTETTENHAYNTTFLNQTNIICLSTTTARKKIMIIYSKLQFTSEEKKTANIHIFVNRRRKRIMMK